MARRNGLLHDNQIERLIYWIHTHTKKCTHSFSTGYMVSMESGWTNYIGWGCIRNLNAKCTLFSHILIQDRLLIQSISFLHTVSKNIIFATSLSLNQCSPIQCLLFHEWCFQNAIRLSIGIRFWFNSFSRSNKRCGTIWRQRSMSALAQVMACCLISLVRTCDNYLNFTRETHAINRLKLVTWKITSLLINSKLPWVKYLKWGCGT